MTLYCYKCNGCGNQWQRVGSALDAKTRPARPVCPKCKGRKTSRDMRAELGGLGVHVSNGFWSQECGIFPQDFKNLCKQKGLDPKKTQTVELEGFRVRQNGNVWIPNKSTWRDVKRSRGCGEVDSYYG